MAILVLSKSNVLPGRKLYWDEKDDMTKHMVRNVKKRDKFIEIAPIMHCKNNYEINEDKLFKFYK